MYNKYLTNKYITVKAVRGVSEKYSTTAIVDHNLLQVLLINTMNDERTLSLKVFKSHVAANWMAISRRCFVNDEIDKLTSLYVAPSDL